MVPLLQQARRLRDERARLQLEAIERPEERPGFHALFRDLHAFARGVGSPGRVATLARGLARFCGAANEVVGGDGQEQRRTGKNKAVDRAGLLQEEAVWQGAAGSFVSRCRAEYGEAYVDVVTGITEAVEVTRLGLRVLAAACASSPSPVSEQPKAVPVHPLVRLQGMLLSFPYPCAEGLTAVGDDGGEGAQHDLGLGEALQAALGPAGLEAAAGAGTGGPASGAQHVMLVQVGMAWFGSLVVCVLWSCPLASFFFSRRVACVRTWYLVLACCSSNGPQPGPRRLRTLPGAPTILERKNSHPLWLLRFLSILRLKVGLPFSVARTLFRWSLESYIVLRDCVTLCFGVAALVQGIASSVGHADYNARTLCGDIYIAYDLGLFSPLSACRMCVCCCLTGKFFV